MYIQMDIEKYPDNTLFCDIYPEIRKLLVQQVSSNNLLKIYSNILKSLNRQLTAEKCKLQKQNFIIDKNTKCYICGRTIGMSIPQVYNGKIAHLCHDL
jgi:hypothetical protein